MSRKNHSYSQRLAAFRLSRSVSTELPFRLLRTYLELAPINNKEELYAKVNMQDPTIVDDLKDAFAVNAKHLTAEDDYYRFRNLYQATSLLKKYPFKGNSSSCRAQAISRFYLSERMCKRTNKRLHHFRVHHGRLRSNLTAVRAHARDIISRVLGEIDLHKILEFAGPGPGLTHDSGFRKSSETTKFFKYTDNLHCTPEVNFLVKGMIARDPHWLTTALMKYKSKWLPFGSRLQQDLVALDHFVDDVEGNRLTFVPKDATTDRTIAIEPSGNVMLQLGVGTYIKNRLAPWGINLRDQSKNQAFAKLGSLNHTDRDPFVTIDMSMASDTLSIGTVRDLLPSDWFEFLNRLRSKKGVLLTEGEQISVEYEKFSSMGNGFTFELESLIFFALTLANRRLLGKKGRHHNDITVFGDDIVCRRSVYEPLVASLSHWGFQINDDKSFTKGPFRESCGKDYFFGKNVRPFFLRRTIRTVRDLHFVANSLMYKCLNDETTIHWDGYEIIFSQLPKKYILPGPLHFDLLQKTKKGIHSEQLVNDDLESCLRVPLSWALNNGFYKPGAIADRRRPFQGFVYKRLLVDPVVFNKQYDTSEFTEAGRYHTFLQGVNSGNIVLRGVSKTSLRTRTSSRWDGSYGHFIHRYAAMA